MNISVMTFPFHGMFDNGSLSPESFIEQIAAAGATGIETMYGWENKSPKLWKRLIDAAHANGLAQACYDIGVNLVATTQEERDNALAKCAERLLFAHDTLGCKTALIYSSHPAPGMSIPEARAIFGDMLAKVSRIAKPLGITVTLEDFDPLPDFVCSAAACMEVLARAPRAGLTFDTGNFLVADDLPYEILADVIDRVVHVHVKEKKRVPPCVEHAQMSLRGVGYCNASIGDGSAQIGLCADTLLKHGYTGWFSVETIGGTLKQTLDGLKFLAARA